MYFLTLDLKLYLLCIRRMKSKTKLFKILNWAQYLTFVMHRFFCVFESLKYRLIQNNIFETEQKILKSEMPHNQNGPESNLLKFEKHGLTQIWAHDALCTMIIYDYTRYLYLYVVDNS